MPDHLVAVFARWLPRASSEIYLPWRKKLSCSPRLSDPDTPERLDGRPARTENV